MWNNGRPDNSYKKQKLNLSDMAKNVFYQGIICPQTPTGSCRVYINKSDVDGTVSPVNLSAHPASLQNRNNMINIKQQRTVVQTSSSTP